MRKQVEKTGEVVERLRETVRRFPDRPAVSDVARTITYRELWCAADAYAAEKSQSKVAVEGGVANLVEARASVDFAVAVIGTYLAGRVLVPYAKDAPESVINRIRQEIGQIPLSTSPATSSRVSSPLANILYTSGTTGTTKGVMLSHRAVWLAANYQCEVDRSDETTVCLIASPLNHISALVKMLSCFLVGAHAVLLDGFIDLKRYYEMVSRHRANVLLLPPSAVQMMLAVARDRLRALADQIREVYSSGSPMSEAVRESLRTCLPKSRLIIAYGATEICGSCCTYDTAEFPGRENGVGWPSPYAKISVEDGCLVVSGESLMEGYLNDPALTAQVLRGGKLHTNDLGRIDGDGFVSVIGRKDDVINCGGLKVCPTEVEAVAMRYPKIRECACFGVDDRFAGSAVGLLAVPRDAQDIDLTDFRRFLQQRLERHQVPTQIFLASEIPKTPNGKTDRKRLIADVLQVQTEDNGGKTK